MTTIDMFDQKPHVVDAAICNLPWGGVKGGKRFRCYLCGHKFVPGDVARWQHVAKGFSNFLVCESCDGEYVIERWIEHHRQYEEWKKDERFWRFNIQTDD